MKKRIIWVAGVIGLIVLIVGAYVLYGKLSEVYKPGDRLAQLGGEGSRENFGADQGEGALSESGTASDGETTGSGATSGSGETPGSGSASGGGETSGSGSASDSEETSGSGSASDSGETPGSGSASDGKEQETPPEDSPQPAPDFTVTDYDGEEVKLSDYFGKPIVLNFWASWCSPCKAELPDFDEAYQNHSEVQFLMVNMTDGSRETVETAREHVDNQGYGFPVFYDTESSAANAYYVNSIPTTYFIDGEGNLIAYARGMLDAETLERGIAMIAEPDPEEGRQDSQAP